MKVATTHEFFKGKKVLVTGHTGFKGSWLTQWLLLLGSEVAGFSNGIPTAPSLFEHLGLKSHIHDFRGDIRDVSVLRKSIEEFKPEIIFHLAAQSLVSVGYLKPKETFEINVGGTVNILEVLKTSDFIKATVLVTSDKCYAPREEACIETSPLGGSDPYSASKACAELVFRSYVPILSKLNNVATARSGNVIGGGDWAAGRLIPDCMRAVEQSTPLILRKANATRSWIYILDILNGYLKLAQELYEGDLASSQSFNFGTQEMCEVSAIVKKLGLSFIKQESESYEENNFLLLDSSKARSILKWEPRYKLNQFLSETKEWYRNAYSNPKNVSEFTINTIKVFDKLK